MHKTLAIALACALGTIVASATAEIIDADANGLQLPIDSQTQAAQIAPADASGDTAYTQALDQTQATPYGIGPLAQADTSAGISSNQSFAPFAVVPLPGTASLLGLGLGLGLGLLAVQRRITR